MLRIANKKRSGRIYSYFIYSGFIFAVAAIIMVAIDNMHALIVVGSIFLIYISVIMLIKPGYFECECDEERINIKFYPIATVVRDYKTFEFHPSRLVHFEIKKSYLGLRKQLLITVSMQKGPAEYPPISVSSLNKMQLAMLNEGLTKYMAKK